MEITKLKLEITNHSVTDKPKTKFSIATTDSNTKIPYYPEFKNLKEKFRPESQFAVKANKTTPIHVESFKAKASKTSTEKLEKISSTEKHTTKVEMKTKKLKEEEPSLQTALNQKKQTYQI